MRASRRRAAEASPEVPGVPHLVFDVAGDAYALRLGGVREIVGLGGLAAAPGGPPVLRGLLDLRGERLAVVDLAAALCATGRSETPESCALVVAGAVEAGCPRAALAVDGVSGVCSLGPEQVAPTPRLGRLVDAAWIAGVARFEQRLVPILDLDGLLASAGVRGAVAAAREARA